MSSGLQDEFGAFQREHDKGKGKGEQVTAEDLCAAGFLSFISAGTGSSSTPYSRTDERGLGLPSGPRNKGKGVGKGKGKAKGKDKGWDMSLAYGPVKGKDRDKGKGEALPPWWQQNPDPQVARYYTRQRGWY